MKIKHSRRTQSFKEKTVRRAARNDRKPINIPCVHMVTSLAMLPRLHSEEGQPLQQMLLGKLDIICRIRTSGYSPHAIYRNDLKMEWRHSNKTGNYKTQKTNLRGRHHDVGFGNDFMGLTPKTEATKVKDNQQRLNQTWKFLYNKQWNNEKSSGREKMFANHMSESRATRT